MTTTLSNDGSAQTLSVDEYNKAVYWANYVQVDDEHRVMLTYYSGTTMDLNISYAKEIKIAQDLFNLYVLDIDNARIDKYKKTSLEKIGNITTLGEGKDLIMGFGKYMPGGGNKCIIFCIFHDISQKIKSYCIYIFEVYIMVCFLC